MPKAVVKEDPKTKARLVKGGAKTGDHPAVTKAKEKKIATQPKFDEMKDPEFVRDEQLEAWAIERKKISIAKTQLMAKETELGDMIKARLKELKITHYKYEDLVEIDLEAGKEKLKIKVDVDDDDE